ncbi:MAG: phage tail assembly protein [Gammaproteobacteria bacterium]|nr:MAG: phage tail assembly protein [Gammaproteobacteria bacterium]
MSDNAIKTIRLKYPITANGEVIDTLELPRPRVKHLKALDEAEGDVDKSVRLISALAAIPPSAVEEMDGEDFAAVSEAVAGFFGGVLPTGGK